MPLCRCGSRNYPVDVPKNRHNIMADIANVDVFEIDMTPQMIKAGACEVAFHSPDLTNNQTTAVGVYLAMEKVRRWLTQKHP